MADRILIWHVTSLTAPLPVYYMERDYTPVKVRLYAAQEGSRGFEVDIRDDGTTIFANRTPTLIKAGEILTTIGYNTLTGTFTAGEFISGGSSSAQAQIVTDKLGNMTVRMTTAGSFTDGETLTGESSGATAKVLSSKRGYPTQTISEGAERTVAILHAGDNLEEDAEEFPDSIPSLEVGSIVTCVPVDMGGRSEVTVQLELEADEGD